MPTIAQVNNRKRAKIRNPKMDRITKYLSDISEKLKILSGDACKMVASNPSEKAEKVKEETMEKSHEQGAIQSIQPKKTAQNKNEPQLKSLRPLTVLRSGEQAHKDAQKNPDETYIMDRLNEIMR
ncbi:MAG: hypothetical protein WC375_09690 [Methanomassiliicoccales archaeon]|jgi:hypothetical protein